MFKMGYQVKGLPKYFQQPFTCLKQWWSNQFTKIAIAFRESAVGVLKYTPLYSFFAE